ncbi:hypothetical protein D1007_12713 [Hordeum vulgare]|nr:hypothetical protein D1007_12713 [Hordeum vulgare]
MAASGSAARFLVAAAACVVLLTLSMNAAQAQTTFECAQCNRECVASSANAALSAACYAASCVVAKGCPVDVAKLMCEDCNGKCIRGCVFGQGGIDLDNACQFQCLCRPRCLPGPETEICQACRAAAIAACTNGCFVRDCVVQFQCPSPLAPVPPSPLPPSPAMPPSSAMPPSP